MDKIGWANNIIRAERFPLCMPLPKIFKISALRKKTAENDLLTILHINNYSL